MVAAFLFIVTSVVSAAFVLGMFSTGGDLNPSTRVKLSWGVVLGAGCLAGIGFTMALFIAELALPEELLYPAKVGVLGGSLIAAIAGMAILLWRLPKTAGEAGPS